ncbi:ABC transporter substrate-binding protein [Bradyrhizobium arachidis]|uniref:ABC transporter substrate-binding protein n=1 Tax=Bradyrhizobium arachidis TaxID=858423 RepID=A0AAE7NKQ8_9BRAD|nr:ABC transporter substrate-binding protein [Bradyrhizobium arachidis]QOZ67167.1 ABC transporter substrate-binding protein [Bradyrhizobium arachidis]SFV16058.1 putative ABC transport system substrate-binding protein [Bradyrhizobium arachidis]
MRRLITRRAWLTSGLAFLSATIETAAEPRRWRVGYLDSGRATVGASTLRGALRKLGYDEGRNLIVDVREANGKYGLLPALAEELVELKPDVIVANATPAIAAAQKATSTIPIVMSPATDPIGSGFVLSFTHPGKNITGVANMFGDTTTKILDIIRLVFPNAKKIGVLTSNNPTHPPLAQLAVQAAQTLGISASLFAAKDPEDLESAFAQMNLAHCDVVYVLADPPRPSLPTIALQKSLPTVFQVNSYVTNYEGLISYGPDNIAFFTKAASYVDRILKGSKPAEMPVEQPTAFQLVVNLRTARALHVTIPEQVLLMADQVID